MRQLLMGPEPSVVAFIMDLIANVSTKQTLTGDRTSSCFKTTAKSQICFTTKKVATIDCELQSMFVNGKCFAIERSPGSHSRRHMRACAFIK